MATIKAFIRTSAKNKKVLVRIRLSDGRDFTRYGVTDIEILPEYWDAKKEEIKSRALLPDGLDKYSINAEILNIKQKVLSAYNKVSNKLLLHDKWLESIISDEKINVEKNPTDTSISTLFNKYLSESKASELRKKQVAVAGRMLERFFIINNTDTLTEDNLSMFEKFLKDEHLLQYKYPEQYKKVKEIKPRGQNTINSKLKMISAFYTWAIKNKYPLIHPFEKYEFSPDVYGDPIPLTPEEVDYIFNAKVHDGLSLIRDMFCLQCYLGCRVNDFIHLRKDNIDNDILIYIASKTITDNSKTVYVPLVDNAQTIINRYDCEDGRLMPFINVDGHDGYNKGIKDLAKFLKLDRNVMTINPLTRKPESKKLYEVISTHTARRTFINSNYKETQDPVLIAKMTGHSEKSRSFYRYRKIDMDILREQMNRAFGKKKK